MDESETARWRQTELLFTFYKQECENLEYNLDRLSIRRQSMRDESDAAEIRRRKVLSDIDAIEAAKVRKTAILDELRRKDMVISVIPEGKKLVHSIQQQMVEIEILEKMKKKLVDSLNCLPSPNHIPQVCLMRTFVDIHIKNLREQLESANATMAYVIAKLKKTIENMKQ